ncbi:MAG: SGNH/GDSL hydrolase family protein, partial [Luteolibacter sp.]
MFQFIRNSRFIPVLAVFSAVFFPAVSQAVEPVRVVGTGGRMGNNVYDPGAVNTSFRQRTQHKLGGPVAEMQIAFMDWVVYYEGEVPNAICDVTIDHAWLERASTGQIVPLTFSGSRQLVMPMNSTTAYWPSDPIPSSTWIGVTPARDEIFWLHVKGSVPSGGRIPVGPGTTWTGAKFIAYPPANDPNTFDTGGTVPAISASATRNNGLPMIFLGRYTGPGHLSVIGIGDSILDGTGDQANPLPSVAGHGFFNRAAVDANGANAIAMFNLTRHGQTAANFANPGRRQRQVQFLPFANVVVEEYGTNDLGSGGGGNATTLLTNVNTIWSLARAAGVQKIIRTKLMPRTTSTDNWMSLAGQTPRPEWGSGGKRDTINAGFATALANGKIDVVLDTHAVLADSTDNSRWRTNGTAKYVNVDEAHVSPAGNILLAPHLRTALLSLTVDVRTTTYQSWSSTIQWAGADTSPTADPNGDGLNNQLAYALDLSPISPIPSGGRPRT